MKIVDHIASQIILKREINREGEFAFRSHQRSMDSTKQHLSDARESMLEAETFYSTETFNIGCGGNTKEIRDVILNDRGIFQKITYLSGANDNQVCATQTNSSYLSSVILLKSFNNLALIISLS